MGGKAPTKKELFLELAKPNNRGFSRPVRIEEFTERYERLIMGNGGDWCREDGALGKIYNIKRNKEKGSIVSVQLQGYKKQPIEKPIPMRIKREIIKNRCIVLQTSRPECDHKDGRRDDPRLSDPNRVEIGDFQPLSKAANNAKRQHCKECRMTDKRFDARRLGYQVSQFMGNGDYNGTCIGCYWHDPIEFNKQVSKGYKPSY